MSSTPDIIQAPKGLVPIMQAFHADTEESANLLILEAAKVIYGKDDNDYDLFNSKKDISKEELQAVTALMKGLNPQDTLEMFYSAQIVVCHLFGMRKLSDGHRDDQNLGLKLLRFSNEAMQHLEKKRSNNPQNITIDYQGGK